MDNKKNGIPKLRFPGFTGAWEQRKLGEMVEKSTIKNSDLEYSKEDILSVATMSDMSFSRDINSTENYMKTYNKILYGEIAFEGHSNKKYRFGRFVLNDYRNGIVSHIYDIYKIIIDYDMNFMKEWISLDRVMYKPLVNSTTSARMMNSLQAKKLYKQKVLLPDLQEQKEIGNFLNKFDTLIALHQRKLEHLQEQKKGLLQKMFPKNGENVPEVRFPGFTDAWEQRKLGEMVEKSTIKNSDLEYSKEDILSVATMSDMSFSRDINSTENYMKTYNKILYGEIAFEGHSNKKYRFGRFVLNDYRNGIVSHIYDIYKIIIDYDMNFMKEWISLDRVMYKPLVNSTTSARMMNSLQAKKLYKQKVLLPDLQEQKEIGNFLNKFDTLIALHQRKLDHLELMKKGLLQQMFV